MNLDFLNTRNENSSLLSSVPCSPAPLSVYYGRGSLNCIKFALGNQQDTQPSLSGTCTKPPPVFVTPPPKGTLHLEQTGHHIGVMPVWLGTSPQSNLKYLIPQIQQVFPIGRCLSSRGSFQISHEKQGVVFLVGDPPTTFL